MNQPVFLAGFGLAVLFAVSLAAEAQQVPKVPKVGLVSPAWRTDVAHIYQAMEGELRRLGYVEGRTILFEYRFANAQPERVPELVAELVQLKPEVIVAGTDVSIAAAKQATTTIPIVMLLARDPVRQGFVASLARPGSNLTGVTYDVTPEISGKNVELLVGVVPKDALVGVLWNATSRLPNFRAVEAAARHVGLRVQSHEVRTASDFDSALATITRQRAQAVLVLTDPLVYSRQRQILEVVARNRLPAVFDVREWVEKGGLMSYGVNMPALARRAAHYVDRILRGEKPGNLPVEQPTMFELVINLKTAKALGLTVPQSLLVRTDEVIQ